MTTPTDDEKLLALAKKATQGPWVIIPPTPHEDEEGCFTHPGGIEGSDGNPVCVFGDPSGSGTMFENEVNPSYIAAANPAAIIALIERHRAEVERLTREKNKAEHDVQSVIRSANALASQLEHQRDAAESALAAERKRCGAMADVLEWLDRRGGLGFDAHDRIRAALAGKDARGKHEATGA